METLKESVGREKRIVLETEKQKIVRFFVPILDAIGIEKAGAICEKYEFDSHTLQGLIIGEITIMKGQIKAFRKLFKATVKETQSDLYDFLYRQSERYTFKKEDEEHAGNKGTKKQRFQRE